jgi:hypothetical protein
MRGITSVRITVHGRNFKLIKSHNSLEADVALQVLRLLESHARIGGHTDDNPGFLVDGWWRFLILFMGCEGVVVKLEDDTDVALVFRKLRVLERLQVQNSWGKTRWNAGLHE